MVTESIRLTARELGSVMALAGTNQAVTIAVRRQPIDESDRRHYGVVTGVRSYVVTLDTDDDKEYQFLLISGPGIDDAIDVVALTGRKVPE